MIAYTIVECNIKVKILYILHKISCWMKPQKIGTQFQLEKTERTLRKEVVYTKMIIFFLFIKFCDIIQNVKLLRG